MHEIQCYNCHNFGHVATYCWSRTYTSNQQMLQHYQQQRRLVKRYNHGFYSYCYSCHLFGHKAHDCTSTQWRRSTFHTRFRSSMSRRRVDPLGHVECFICHRFFHMERLYLLPHYSRQNYQKQQKKRWYSRFLVKKERKQVKEHKKHHKTVWRNK